MKTFHGIGRLRVAMFLVAGLLLAACGSGEPAEETSSSPSETASAANEENPLDELIAAAEEEGQVVWYGSMDEAIVKAASDAFTEEYGIAVEYVRLVSNDLLVRYSSELESGAVVADLIVSSHGDFAQPMVDAGQMIAVEDAGIPALEDYPEELFELGLAKIGAETHGIVVNTDLVKPEDEPKDWTDLADPKWKDKLLVVDPSSSVGYPGTWTRLVDEYGEDLLRGIGENAKQFTAGMTPHFEMVAAGEGAVGVPSLQSTAARLQAAGAPVKHIQPDYAPMFLHALGLSADAPHPNAAKLFAHFLMVGEGQSIINDPERWGRCSPVTGHGCPENAVPQRVEDLARSEEIYELLGL